MLNIDEHNLLLILKRHPCEVGDLVEILYPTETWSGDSKARKRAKERTRYRVVALAKQGLLKQEEKLLVCKGKPEEGVFTRKEWSLTIKGLSTLQEYTKVHLYLTLNSLSEVARRVGLDFKQVLKTVLSDPEL